MIYRLIISGRVQGVGYRNWAVITAQKLGEISGFVRNLETGDVEVVMKGDEKSLQKMLTLCYKGPLFARVDEIEINDNISDLEYPNLGNTFNRN